MKEEDGAEEDDKEQAKRMGREMRYFHGVQVGSDPRNGEERRSKNIFSKINRFKILYYMDTVETW